MRCVAAAGAATLLPRAFLPPFNEGTFTINMLFNPGISLAESNRVGLIAEKLILGVPEVKAVGRRTGRAELDEHAEGVHSSEIEVDLKEGGRSKDAIIADLRARLAVLPVSLNIGQPISHRLDHMLSGVRAQIVIKFFGEDLDTLRALARGVSGAAVQALKVLPTCRSKSRCAFRSSRSWSTTREPRSTACSRRPSPSSCERLSNGRVVSRLVDGTRRFDVVMRLNDNQRTTQGLGDLLLEITLWLGARCATSPRSGKATARIRSCAKTASAAWSCSPMPMARPT